jgi:peptidoglycan/LPS O-acetylase OafA/YrhL
MALLLWAAIFLLVYFAETHPSDVTIQKAAAIFTNRVSQYLGKISYSIYLFHWLALMIVLRVIYLVDPQITSRHALLWMFPGVIGLTILVSDQLNRWVEEPCIRFGKRLFREDVR